MSKTSAVELRCAETRKPWDAGSYVPEVLRQGAPTPSSLNDLAVLLPRWREMLHYDPVTGALWLKQTLGNPLPMDRKLATKVDRRGRGRNKVSLDGFTVPAADVVWLLHNGVWPKSRLVQRDDDPFNDRIENLYERLPTSTRWRVQVTSPDGRQIDLGLFPTEAAAGEARRLYYDSGERLAKPRGRPHGVYRTSAGVSRSVDRWQAWGRSEGRQRNLGVRATREEAQAIADAFLAAEDLV